MTVKYHVNPETGRTGQCTASYRPCKFGISADEHYATKEEAAAAYEESMKDSLVSSTVSKSADVTDLTKVKLDKYTLTDPNIYRGKNAKEIIDNAVKDYEDAAFYQKEHEKNMSDLYDMVMNNKPLYDNGEYNVSIDRNPYKYKDKVIVIKRTLNHEAEPLTEKELDKFISGRILLERDEDYEPYSLSSQPESESFYIKAYDEEIEAFEKSERAEILKPLYDTVELTKKGDLPEWAAAPRVTSKGEVSHQLVNDEKIAKLNSTRASNDVTNIEASIRITNQNSNRWSKKKVEVDKLRKDYEEKVEAAEKVKKAYPELKEVIERGLEANETELTKAENTLKSYATNGSSKKLEKLKIALEEAKKRREEANKQLLKIRKELMTDKLSIHHPSPKKAVRITAAKQWLKDHPESLNIEWNENF